MVVPPASGPFRRCQTPQFGLSPIVVFFLVVIAISVVSGCSRDPSGAPPADPPIDDPLADTTAPAKVLDLRATALNDSTVFLDWTAPGDDGVEGRATLYDLRYSTEPFPAAGSFPPGMVAVPGVPVPSVAGTQEIFRVVGFERRTTYYFGIRVEDEEGNQSPISNISYTTTTETLVVIPPDVTPPAAVSLSLTRITNNSVSISWRAPGDNGNDGRAQRYELRYSLNQLITDETWAQALVIPTAAPRMAGQLESATVDNLPHGTIIAFALKSYDKAGNESALSPEFHVQTHFPDRLIVREDGTGDAPTIQAAINLAQWGDTVLVEPGTYFENVHFRGRDIVLMSRDGYETTIIDGRASGSVVRFEDGETNACVIQGFTIRNGYVSGASTGGGGIAALNSVPMIRKNYLVANRSHGGGGIGLGAKPGQIGVIEDNRIEDNASEFGGGVYINGRIRIRGNVFARNTAQYDGGGLILFFAEGASVVEGNSFFDNVAQDHGGAIAGGGRNSIVEIRDNLFVRNLAYGNDAPDPPDLGEAGGAIGMAGNVRIVNNTFSANRGLSTLPDSSGGAIGWWAPHSEDIVYIGWNIIEGSEGCGVAFPSPLNRNGTLLPAVKLTIDPNLFWQNSLKHVAGFRPDQQHLWTGKIQVGDPLFCDPASGDYRVPPGSPAVNGLHPFGAFYPGGCGGP